MKPDEFEEYDEENEAAVKALQVLCDISKAPASRWSDGVCTVIVLRHGDTCVAVPGSDGRCVDVVFNAIYDATFEPENAADVPPDVGPPSGPTGSA